MEPYGRSGAHSSVTDQIGETGTKPVPSCLPESVLGKQVECETSENLVWGSSSQDSDPLCSDVNPFKTAFNPLFSSSVSVTVSAKYEDKIDIFNDTECKVEESVAQLPSVVKTKSAVHVVPPLKCSDSLSTDSASDPKNLLTFNALQTSDMHQHLLNSAVFSDLNASFEHKHFEDSFMDFEEQAQTALTIKSNSITKNQPIQLVSPIEFAPVTILPIGQTSVAGSPPSLCDLPMGPSSVAGSSPSLRDLPMGPSSVAGSPQTPRDLPMGPSSVAGSPQTPRDLPMGPSSVAGSPQTPCDLPMGPSSVAGSPQTPRDLPMGPSSVAGYQPSQSDLPFEQCSVTGTSSTLTMLRLGESHMTKSLPSEKLLPVGAIPAAGKVPSEAVIEDSSSLLFFEPSGIVKLHSSELYCPSLGMSVPALPVSRKELSSSGAFDLFGEILQPLTVSDSSKSLTTDTHKKQSPVKPIVEGDLESSLANLAQNLDIGVPTQHLKKFEAHQWGPTKSTVKSNAGTMSDGGRWVGSSAVPSGNASWVSSQAGYQPMMALGMGMDIGMSMGSRGTQPMGVFGRMQPNSSQPSVAGSVDPFGDL
ncbi:uncharacterized protein LOC143257209 isoform X2 [Tachypleus tridentatus]|uniref:uncharacterized protein LOC143257209 isoform X2 n=1 Tax=Tachypleus tridentatus TaxID=6853 RepID=UPI003FD45ACC